MEDAEQEKINEQSYEKLLLSNDYNDSFLKEGDTSPCPLCLDDVTRKEDHTTSITYTIQNQKEGSTHMEIYHEKCWKYLQKEIHKIEANFKK